MHSLGNAFGGLGDYQKQKELLQRARSIQERAYGTEHVEVAATVSDLGSVFGGLSDYRKQKQLLELALSIQDT